MSRVLPILFNTEMVAAIKDNQKSVTRRVIKQDKIEKVLNSPVRKENPDTPDVKFISRLINTPYSPGDILYVRERFCIGEIVCGEDTDGSAAPYVSQPGYNYIPYEYCIRKKIGIENVRWKPGIHMPKECARIWLKVTDVRVEKLWDITNDEAKKEGVVCVINSNGDAHRFAFSKFWDSTVKKADPTLYGWDANPWVWVISFERCEKPEEV